MTAAAQQGRKTKSLIQEAVEHLLNYDELFARQVEEGLSAAETVVSLSSMMKSVSQLTAAIPVEPRSLDASGPRSHAHLRLHQGTRDRRVGPPCGSGRV